MTIDIHSHVGENHITTVPHRPNREEQDFEMGETFGLDLGDVVKHGKPELDANGNPVKRKKMIKGFKEKGILTPDVNPHYRFPAEETKMFLMSLALKNTTYLVGHSGTGKTELIKQVAARLNYNVVLINFDGHLSRSDLIGSERVVNGQMRFRYGLVPIAFSEPGTIVLFDEVDACPPETAFVLQRAVSSDRRFLMQETNQLFELHPQNVICATANTNGLGDESALYIAGTNVQNFSFLNRWETTIQVDYLTREEEAKVLNAMFPKKEQLVDRVTKVLEAAREAFKAGTLTLPLTTRDGMNWMTKMNLIEFPMRMARYSFLNKLPTQDAIAVAQMIQRNFVLPPTDDKKFIGAGQVSGRR